MNLQRISSWAAIALLALPLAQAQSDGNQMQGQAVITVLPKHDGRVAPASFKSSQVEGAPGASHLGTGDEDSTSIKDSHAGNGLPLSQAVHSDSISVELYRLRFRDALALLT